MSTSQESRCKSKSQMLLGVVPVQAVTVLALVAALALPLLTACGGGASAPALSGQVKVGYDLYQSQGCAVCHGKEGRGDGPAAASLGAKPRDFRSAEGFRGPRSVESIAQVLVEGVPGSGGGMPAYPHLSEADRSAIAAYVLSLGPGGAKP
jgi:mono/diheme cytochrome c family protein